MTVTLCACMRVLQALVVHVPVVGSVIFFIGISLTWNILCASRPSPTIQRSFEGPNINILRNVIICNEVLQKKTKQEQIGHAIKIKKWSWIGHACYREFKALDCTQQVLGSAMQAIPRESPKTLGEQKWRQIRQNEYLETQAKSHTPVLWKGVICDGLKTSTGNILI